jgi:hypothetical protein
MVMTDERFLELVNEWTLTLSRIADAARARGERLGTGSLWSLTDMRMRQSLSPVEWASYTNRRAREKRLSGTRRANGKQYGNRYDLFEPEPRGLRKPNAA